MAVPAHMAGQHTVGMAGAAGALPGMGPVVPGTTSAVAVTAAPAAAPTSSPAPAPAPGGPAVTAGMDGMRSAHDQLNAMLSAPLHIPGPSAVMDAAAGASSHPGTSSAGSGGGVWSMHSLASQPSPAYSVRSLPESHSQSPWTHSAASSRRTLTPDADVAMPAGPAAASSATIPPDVVGMKHVSVGPGDEEDASLLNWHLALGSPSRVRTALPQHTHGVLSELRAAAVAPRGTAGAAGGVPASTGGRPPLPP